MGDMRLERLADVVGRQTWLEPIEDGIQKAMTRAFAAAGPREQQVKNLLHGTWLHHPLHPVLTSVPIGSWTMAVTLDAADAMRGRDDLAPGADAAVGLGVMAALAAAAA